MEHLERLKHEVVNKKEKKAESGVGEKRRFDQ